jgi:hypothetical protein
VKLKHSNMNISIPHDIVQFAEKITGVTLLDHQKNFLREFVSDHEKNYIISAPRGSGKTWIAAIICSWYLTHMKNYSIVITSGSREQASRMMSYILYFFTGPLAGFIKQKNHLGRRQVYVAENNSRLTLIASSEQSRRGEHSNMLVIDEAEAIDDDTLLDYLGIPTLEPSRILIVSTIDWQTTFSVFKAFIKGSEEYGFNYVKWTAADAIKIPGWKKAYEREKLRAGYNRAWFLTQWEGEFAVEEGLVFKNLENCISRQRLEPQEGYPIRIGVDWGYTHNTVITVAQKVGKIINVLRTYAYRNVTFSAITKHLLSIYSEYERYTSDIAVISDASAMGTEKTAELRSYGINVIGVPFMNEKLSHLIPNAVAWVENGALRIYEGETKLLEQMASYYWETSESGKLKTKKASDDFVDSLLLALRDWRFVDVLGEPEENIPTTPSVSVYNFPQTERFMKILRGEYNEPV